MMRSMAPLMSRVSSLVIATGVVTSCRPHMTSVGTLTLHPGSEWSVNKERARSRMRLCFASLSHEEIHQGVAALADVCRKEFGLPR